MRTFFGNLSPSLPCTVVIGIADLEASADVPRRIRRAVQSSARDRVNRYLLNTGRYVEPPVGVEGHHDQRPVQVLMTTEI